MSRYWKIVDSGEQVGDEVRLVIATGFFEPIAADSFRRNLGVASEQTSLDTNCLPARWVQSGTGAAGAIVFPTRACSPGSDQANERLLLIPESAPMSPELMARAGIDPQPRFRSDNEPSFAVHELPATFEPPAVAASVSFDGLITFLGYEIPSTQQAESFQLLTFWRVDSLLPWDLGIFVHLLDSEGHISSQHDGLDAAAVTLKPGDIFIQNHQLPLSDLEASEPYSLQMGLYTRSDGHRLNHAGQPSDRILLVDSLFLTGSE
jgi:hypothetical protein